MPWKGKPFGWGQPTPYLQFLPPPEDATVNLLRQLNERLAAGENLDGGSIKITVNFIEPPSINLASELLFKAYNTNLEVKRVIGAVPRPDPRKSKASFRLWKYRFKHARPAVPRPAESLIAACGKLALEPYDYQANWQQAATMAQQYDAKQIPEILAVMVHPPLVQDAIESWVWLQRTQLAAAQLVACIELQHQVSLRDSMLIEILLGPIDWTIDAAVIALTQRARHENQTDEWLCRLFFQTANRLPLEGHWGTREVLVRNCQMLPGLSERLQAEIRDVLQLIADD